MTPSSTPSPIPVVLRRLVLGLRGAERHLNAAVGLAPDQTYGLLEGASAALLVAGIGAADLLGGTPLLTMGGGLVCTTLSVVAWSLVRIDREVPSR